MARRSSEIRERWSAGVIAEHLRIYRKTRMLSIRTGNLTTLLSDSVIIIRRSRRSTIPARLSSDNTDAIGLRASGRPSRKERTASSPVCSSRFGGGLVLMADVHATSDGVILMFHDPTLDRTTTGKGLIRKQPWKGVIE